MIDGEYHCEDGGGKEGTGRDERGKDDIEGRTVRLLVQKTV